MSTWISFVITEKQSKSSEIPMSTYQNGCKLKQNKQTTKWIISNAGKDTEQLAISHFWWEGPMVQPLWKTLSQKIKYFLTILNIYLPYDPVIPLLGVYQYQWTHKSTKKVCPSMFIVDLFLIVRNWKQSKCSLSTWLKKLVEPNKWNITQR